MKKFQNRALNKYFIDHVQDIEKVLKITQYMTQQEQTFEYCSTMDLIIYPFQIDVVIDFLRLKIQIDSLGEIHKQNILTAILKAYVSISNFDIQHCNLSNHESILLIKDESNMDMVQAIECNKFKVMFIHYKPFRKFDDQDNLRQDFHDLLIIFDILMPNKYKQRRLHIYRSNPEIKLLEQIVSKFEQRRSLIRNVFQYFGFKKKLQMYKQRSEKKYCKKQSFLYEYISSELSLKEDCIDGTYYMVNLTKEIDIITEEYLKKKDKLFQDYFEKVHQQSHNHELTLSRIIGDEEEKHEEIKPICLRIPENMMENYIFKQALRNNYNIVELSEQQIQEILGSCQKDLFPRDYEESQIMINNNNQIL
ncbi:hypothetical protein pb186bvf_002870 [Paramecium bursaria]